jgi:GWxTD domain-containing protein
MVTLACASAHARARAGDAPAPAATDWAAYARYGIVEVPLAGVGQFYFLAGATTDSTKVIFFDALVGSEGGELELTRDGAVVHEFNMPPGQFQQTITLAPGTYLTSYGQSVHVPRLGRTALAQPIPMRHGAILPRSTAIIGRDTVIDVYLEAYGTSNAPVTLSAPGWRDTIALHRHGDVSGDTIEVPLSRFAPGATLLVLARGRDSATTPVFVGLGSVTAPSFDGTLDALRYMASPERLDSLRRTPPDERPQAWATFMGQYGQRLPEYLARVREANRRYSDTGIPGWETDRGSVYVQLGDPDQVFVEPDIEIWLYMRYFGRLKFDHRRLMPESREMLGTLVARARSAR